MAETATQPLYSKELWDYMVKVDPTYEADLPYEDFVSTVDADPEFIPNLYNYMVQKDPTFKDHWTMEEFGAELKKKRRHRYGISWSYGGHRYFVGYNSSRDRRSSAIGIFRYRE